MEAVANPLGTKPIRGLIWKFAIPGIITQLVSSVHNIADQVFIGQAMGDLGVAATNVAFPLMTITNAVAALIGMGGAARFSIFLGQKDTEKAARILGNAVSLLLVLGILLSAGASIFLKPLLYLFGATELIMPYASAYSAIISLGIVLGVLSTGLAYFIRADGSPTYSSIVLLSGAIFNIAFDPIFLFGFNMGIRGVALAPVYLASPEDSMERVKELGRELSSLEDMDLLTLDYDMPLRNYPYQEYKTSALYAYFVKTVEEAARLPDPTFDTPALELGSMALTQAGADMVDGLLG